MIRAAVELFEQRGFDQTTTADIAERAGVTERTFFRHFPDKREVLFDGSHRLQHTIDEAIGSAPSDLSPLEAALAGVTATAGAFNEIREHALRRAAIVAVTPSLQERELLKLAGMTEATAAALRRRGAGEPTATLAAHAAVSVFHVAFAHWIQAGTAPDFADCIAEAATALRTMT
jgi:AcrR family transcriptional regulator